MPGLIIDGRQEEVLGLIVTNYKDVPRYKLKPGEDMRARKTRWIRSIVAHTTKGLLTHVKPGCGPDAKVEERISRLWSTDRRQAGAHISIDSDCSVGCHADLVQDAAYHAGSLNEVSIGFEIYQEADGAIYAEQLRCAVVLTQWLCERFDIVRQMPNLSKRDVIHRLEAGGKDCVGVFGHRHQTNNRGPGDPGDHYFQELDRAGFKQFNFTLREDLAHWRDVQRKLGVGVDGVPGPLTCDALRAREKALRDG